MQKLQQQDHPHNQFDDHPMNDNFSTSQEHESQMYETIISKYFKNEWQNPFQEIQLEKRSNMASNPFEQSMMKIDEEIYNDNENHNQQNEEQNDDFNTQPLENVLKFDESLQTDSPSRALLSHIHQYGNMIIQDQQTHSQAQQQKPQQIQRQPDLNQQQQRRDILAQIPPSLNQEQERYRIQDRQNVVRLQDRANPGRPIQDQNRMHLYNQNLQEHQNRVNYEQQQNTNRRQYNQFYQDGMIHHQQQLQLPQIVQAYNERIMRAQGEHRIQDRFRDIPEMRQRFQMLEAHRHHNQQQQQHRHRHLERKPKCGLKPDQIQMLTEIEFKSSECCGWQEEDKQCSICLCDFVTNEKIRFLPCLHRFHTNCVDRWLVTNSQCPLCKKDVKTLLKDMR